MDQYSNIIKDNNINRIVEYIKDSEQINILDQRFYKRNNNYYPSVSTILGVFPKGKFYEDWLKSVGYNADIIAQKAANEGTQVHNAIENFLKGNEIKWMDNKGITLYSLDVWKMILKFSEFWNKHKPELIASEYHVFSDNHRYAGTADLIVRLKDKIYLLDIKTSNSLHTTYNLQLAAYAKAWNEMHNEESWIQETGILWLKAQTRKEKEDKIQGKGWELKHISDIDYNFDLFNKTYDIYKIENKEEIPTIITIPTSTKINF